MGPREFPYILQEISGVDQVYLLEILGRERRETMGVGILDDEERPSVFFSSPNLYESVIAVQIGRVFILLLQLRRVVQTLPPLVGAL